MIPPIKDMTNAFSVKGLNVVVTGGTGAGLVTRSKRGKCGHLCRNKKVEIKPRQISGNTGQLFL